MRRVGGNARPRRDAVPRGAGGETHRRSPARAPGGAPVTNEEKYVAAAYLVIFAVVLAYVVIMSLKLQRLERELAELAELARAKKKTEEEHRAVAVG
ncbi:MAG: CcmD family protein [Actinobacteria bacterium]|nr:MAG: CcmD family protein [Actinomycetota bacterium]